MGQTIEFSCRHCGYDEHINMGVGMFCDIDKLFNGIVDNVRKGQYGDEWRKELENDPSLIVDVSDEIYICPSCGYYTAALNLALYKPVESESHSNSHAPKTYGTDLTLTTNPHYHLFRLYPHLYPKCNIQMTIHSNRDKAIQPTCPKCGGTGELHLDVLWD